MNRAYSTFTIKSVDSEQRIIEGTASTPTTDRDGDVMDPSGVQFTLPMPLLWQHRADQPIGQVIAARVTAAGIQITAQIAKGVLPFIDDAWALISAGLVRGFSVGFKALDAKPIAGGGLRFLKWNWLETSTVTIPANGQALISIIKSLDDASLDAAHLAASGTAPGTSRHTSGASDARAVVQVTTRGNSMKTTYQERIASMEATRLQKQSDLEALQDKVSGEGRTKDESERQQFNDLQAEIKSLDGELIDLRSMEAMNVTKAVPAVGKTQEDASASRSGQRVVMGKDVLPAGIGFARAVKVFGVAKLDSRNPADVAREMYPNDDRLKTHVDHVMRLPNIIAQIKAAVPGANTTTNSLWAGALVNPANLDGEFVEFLRPATIIGRLNLRDIPTNVRLIEQVQGGTGYWVGVGAPKPLTAFGYSPITLTPTKVAAIAVASEEALRYSTPNLDQLIRDGLRDALVERVDRDLLDPAELGTANVQPASLTNGVTPLSSAGPTADNIRTDLANIMQTFRANNLRGPVVIVMPDSLAVAAAFMATSLGTPEFPDLTAEGGTIRGIRVITSEYLANSSGSGNMVVAIAEREVFQSTEGGVQVDASREASLQMLDNPTNNSSTATPTSMVSMWQTNSVAFRGEWYINWKKRRSTAVVFMDDVNWGSIGSPA